MQPFIRLFFNLLLPFSLLFIIVSIGYFTFNYDFSKAIKLGVLSGVLISIGVSFVMAFLLLILRRVKGVKHTEVTNHAGTESMPPHEAAKENKKSAQKHQTGISKEIKCMILMESSLTFEVLLNALKNQNQCTISQSDPQKGTISIQTKEGIIQTTITSLTKHTSEIIILTQNNVKQVRKLISYIKEKEHSFLQY